MSRKLQHTFFPRNNCHMLDVLLMCSIVNVIFKDAKDFCITKNDIRLITAYNVWYILQQCKQLLMLIEDRGMHCVWGCHASWRNVEGQNFQYLQPLHVGNSKHDTQLNMFDFSFLAWRKYLPTKLHWSILFNCGMVS